MKQISIYLICGKARSGKDTFGRKLSDKLKLLGYNPCIMHITEPLYNYAKNYFNWDGNLDNKPREFLQEMGIHIIKEKLGKDKFLINRTFEDIEILSNFFDTFIITDIRLIKEIEEFRKKFQHIKVIYITRLDYDNLLSSKEKEHITEMELDNYNNFDYNFKIREINEIDNCVSDVVEDVV